MWTTNASAAAELGHSIHDNRLTRKSVANHMGVTESWLSRRLSRRLSTVVPMQIDDYVAIQTAVQELSASLVH
ncbi:hypothetical protein EDF62_0056 [Leucobacter luti]|uniref:Uncharacterized protein n=1 Tax=Leucobacter luti TaxID=340320 RepID=A0A4R6S7J0_9MICO|nr:hypothetical protein [Leucobacter luti]TDP95373.1 hypothetical protein EDF62_0056 [Leucobacter luti]